MNGSITSKKSAWAKEARNREGPSIQNVSFQQEEFEDGEVEGEEQDVVDDEEVQNGDEGFQLRGLDAGEELDPMDVPPDDDEDEDQVGDEEEECDDEMEDSTALSRMSVGRRPRHRGATARRTLRSRSFPSRTSGQSFRGGERSVARKLLK